MSLLALAGCVQNQHLTKASTPEMVSGRVAVNTVNLCLSEKRTALADALEPCSIKIMEDSNLLTVAIFNKYGGLNNTIGTRLSEFNAVAIEEMRSREIVDLLDFALSRSTEATLISLSTRLVCSRLPEVARSDAGALVLNYAADRGLCSGLEIERSFLLAQIQHPELGIKTSTQLGCLSTSSLPPVERATARLFERSMARGDYVSTSMALRTMSPSGDSVVSCATEEPTSPSQSFRGIGSAFVDLEAVPYRGTSNDSFIAVSTLDPISPSFAQVRTRFLENRASFASNIDAICARIGGTRVLNDPPTSDHNLYLRNLSPGCYALSASVPLALIGGDGTDSAAGVIVILRHGSFRLVETSKSGAIVIAPKLPNPASQSPRIYGFPVFFYVAGSSGRPAEILAFHWISGLPRKEDGAYEQADVNLSREEPLSYVDESVAGVANLLSQDDKSEIRLDLVEPALGAKVGGIYGTPLRILKNSREVCRRIQLAEVKRLPISVPANWDEALTPSDRLDRVKFCPAGNTTQCFAKVILDLGCATHTPNDNPLPAVLTANVTKFRLGNPQ